MSQAFEPQRWFPQPLLPGEDGHDIAMTLVVIILSFLACLSAIGGLAADRAAAGWKGQLEGSATVVVRPSGTESSDAAAARAAEALSGVTGVSEARAMERAEAEALLKPWLGGAALPADLPVPRLVVLELDRQGPPTVAALNAALKTAGVDATVDDHSAWMADVMRAGALARGFALGLFLLIAAACAGVIAFATRAGLSARRDLVEILHFSGATNAFIARLFQARFARVAAQGGMGGAAAAAVLAGAVRLYGGDQGFAAIFPLAWTDLVAPLPWPVLLALIAAVTARLAALRVLGEAP